MEEPMLSKLQKWKSKNVFIGGIYLLSAILFLLNGGTTNVIIAVCLFLASMIYFFFRPEKTK